MIDAYQATLVAYTTEDGETLHVDCAPIRGTSEDWRENDRVMEEHGYQGMIRYSVHEWESQNWGELEYSVDFELPSELNDFGPDQNVSYEDRTITDDEGTEHDVSAYVDVTCDLCGERIC